MSYILEALLKADRERQKQQAVDHPPQHVIPLPDQALQRHWPAVVASATLLASVTAMAWGILDQRRNPDIVPPAPQATAWPVDPVVEQAIPAIPAAPAPVSSESGQDKSPSPPLPPHEKSDSGLRPPPLTVPRPASRLYGIAELPPALRKEAEKLVVAGFSYAKDASDRMAIINDRPWREGEEIMKGLRIERISSEGVLFNWHGYRFSKGTA